MRAVLGTVLLLAVVAGCIRLGFWQLDRLGQRRSLNHLIAERFAAAPLVSTLPLGDTTSLDTLLYRRILLAGTFDDDRTIVLAGRAHQGVPGVHVLTPVDVTRSNMVLVNRGWLPSADGATISWDSLPPTIVPTRSGVLLGVVLPFPGTATSGTNAADTSFRRVWYRPDRAALLNQYPYYLVPAVVQLLPTPATPTRPVPLEPPTLDSGPHLLYAIQWFSFAAIAVIGWGALVRRSRRERQGGRAPVSAPPLPPAA